jgi:DNA invertase Pin-like site-specific DNA recombinase
VVRLDRLARSLAHMAALGEELNALGIELVSLTENIDTSTQTGEARW